MRYVLSKDTPPTLVMLVGTRTGEKIVMVSAFVIAPVLLLVSTGTLLSEDWDLGLCVGGFGGFLLCVAILMARVPPPPRLLFDLGAQTLRVDELSPSPRAETIPLGDFLGFAVVPTIQSQQTVYEVVLVRRDGAAWRLDVRHRKDQAEAFCAELARRVPLDALPVKATDLRELQLGAGQAIEPFSLQERAGVTRIAWRPQAGAVHPALGLLCVASFGLAFSSCLEMTLSTPWAVVSAVLWALVLLWGTYITLATPSREVIEVTADALRYRRRSRLYLPGPFTMPLSEIHAIQLYYELSSTEPLLFVLNAEQVEAFKRMRLERSKLSELVGLLKARVGASKIRLTGLGFVEMLRLERILQSVVYQRSGKSGL